MRMSPNSSGFCSRFVLPFVFFSVLIIVCAHIFFSPTFRPNAFTNVLEANSAPNAASKSISPHIIEVYRSQIKSRKEILKLVAAGKPPTQYSHADLYNSLVPEVFCPGLVRIGYIADGGKWVCSPHMVRKPCAIYSLGISNEYSFEDQIYEQTKCGIHGFDKDEMKPETVEAYKRMNATIMPALIAKETNVTARHYSFADIIKMYDHSRIDILKIDIEGAEYEVSNQIVSVPICQILIEMHGEAKKMMSLLEKFSKSGFYLFHHEINGAYISACEYSLIHESCLKEYGVEVVLGRYLS
ncbi:hypothetical protein L596_029440 [Steinernema carpocapsae]|uniref:Methyltransferase domain-containing protein n=1 Tax=Steinernema carpocapsae TaxID=34508 RepID=A0A4U5LUM7_STECR|nr:hypothetical protein L596_029440 [Steinernema carpocapsae]